MKENERSLLDELRELGWSEEKITKLVDEILGKKIKTESLSDEELVKNFLTDLGFSSYWTGTVFLREILTNSMQKKPNEIQLQNGLYLLIENKYNVTSFKIVRYINNAISKTFKNRSEFANEFYKLDIQLKRHPTPRKFIIEASEYLQRCKMEK